MDIVIKNTDKSGNRKKNPNLLFLRKIIKKIMLKNMSPMPFFRQKQNKLIQLS